MEKKNYYKNYFCSDIKDLGKLNKSSGVWQK